MPQHWRTPLWLPISVSVPLLYVPMDKAIEEGAEGAEVVAREKLRAEKEWRGSATLVVVSVIVGMFLGLRCVHQREIDRKAYPAA